MVSFYRPIIGFQHSSTFSCSLFYDNPKTKMKKMNILIQCSILIFLFNLSSSQQDAVTCGSTFKLVNQQSGDRLHSHDVKYGSGSGQQVNIHLFLLCLKTFIFLLMIQSVTGTPNADDVNSYWQVRGDIRNDCERG